MDQTCLVVHKSRRPQARLLDSHTVLHTLWLTLYSLTLLWEYSSFTPTPLSAILDSYDLNKTFNIYFHHL
jgi:hypothetical protein